MTRNELKEIIKEIYNKFNFEYGDEGRLYIDYKS